MKKIIYLLKLNLEKIPRTAWLFVSKRIIYPNQELPFGSISQLLKANLLNREPFWWSPKKLRKIYKTLDRFFKTECFKTILGHLISNLIILYTMSDEKVYRKKFVAHSHILRHNQRPNQ